MKHSIPLFLALSVLMFGAVSCQTREAVRLIDDVAYLQIEGGKTGMAFQLDDGPLIPVLAEDTHYQIEPGPHLLRVFFEGATLIERKVYASSGQVLEIRVPKS